MIKINLFEDCDIKTLEDLENLVSLKVPEFACKNGNLDLVHKLILHGYPISKKCWYEAALHNRLDIIQYALQNGFHNMFDESVFKASIEGGNMNIISYLIENFPEFKRKDRGDYIDVALEKGNLYLVDWLLLQGFNLGRYSIGAAKKAKNNLDCINFVLGEYYRTNNLERINQFKGGLFMFLTEPNLKIDFNFYRNIKRLFEDKELNKYYNSGKYLNYRSLDPD